MSSKMTENDVNTAVEENKERENSSNVDSSGTRRLRSAKKNNTHTTKHKRKKPTHEADNTFTASKTSCPQKQMEVAAERGETVMLDDQLINEVSSVKPPKKKRKRKSQSADRDIGIPNIGLASELYELSDDIVPADDNIKKYSGTVFTVPVMRSEPMSKLFIEKKRGFKATDKVRMLQLRADEMERQQTMAADIAPVTTQNTVEYALSTHRLFKHFSVILQGLFGGIALWQIIASYMLLNQGFEAFLSSYYMLARPVQCLFYFLFAVSSVAALDRYDLARPTQTLLVKSLTLQAGTIVVIIYFIGVVFSLVTVYIDERIALYGVDPLLWTNSTQIDSTNTYLFQWQILNLIRGLAAICGWFVFSLWPTVDRLTENLMNPTENTLGPKTSTLPIQKDMLEIN